MLLAAACQRPDAALRAADSTAAGATSSETVKLAGTPVARSAARPLEPRVIERFCPGESCDTDFPALACAPVDLLSIAADSAPIVARVERGDTVQVRTRDLHVLEAGRVVLQRDFALTWDVDMEGDQIPRADTLTFAAGDTVYLLLYTELGGWVVSHRGREAMSGEFWAGPETGRLGAAIYSSDSSVAVGLSHPRTADWWQVEPRSGRAGWWRADTLYSLMSIPAMQKWNDDCPKR